MRRFLRVLTAALVALATVSAAPHPREAGTGARRVAHLHVKFREGTAVRLRNGALVAASGADLTSVDAAIAEAGASVRPLVRLGRPRLVALERRAEAEVVRDVADFRLYYDVVAPRADAGALADALGRDPLVESAYVAPVTAPPPVTPDLTSYQGYRAAGPTGVGGDAVADIPGALGDAVEVVDVEYGWNLAHEDLEDAAGPDALVSNGTPVAPSGFADHQHGTAVLGVVAADDDGIGVTGLAPRAEISAINAYNLERGYDLTTALLMAVTVTEPGDVILIEQQTMGIDGYVPVEWVEAYYDAIVTATSLDRIVVEAAGNGAQDLDAEAYGTPFPAGRPDSGAIIAGAGTTTLSPVSYSTYGSRVDLQGWGTSVATTGYGDLHAGTSPNEWYTARFDGTSSAAAIVAAAAASFSSAYETATGRAPSPRFVRDRLMQTGTPQSSGSEIGPLPDLVAALQGVLDGSAVAPSVSRPRFTFAPAGGITSGGRAEIAIRWAATDADGIASTEVQISADGLPWSTVPLESATATSLRRPLAFARTYDFRVRATDSLGHESAWVSGDAFDLVLIEDGGGLTYDGGWKTVSDIGYTDDAARSTTNPGASAAVSADARAIAWIGTKGPGYGASALAVDGSPIGTRTQHADASRHRRYVYREAWPAPGWHGLVLTCLATPAHPRCDVDGMALIV